MRWTKRSLANPAAVAVVAAIIILLGVMSLFRLPMQLFPDIDRPQITVQTTWRAASPREVEAEINEPLEDVLQGIPGVQEMVTNAGSGNSFVNLTFELHLGIAARPRYQLRPLTKATGICHRVWFGRHCRSALHDNAPDHLPRVAHG